MKYIRAKCPTCGGKILDPPPVQELRTKKAWCSLQCSLKKVKPK